MKSKHHPVLYQKTGRYRHGVDLPNWWDYLHAQDESGCPGYLGIVQLTDGPDRPVSPRFLLASFEHLRFRAQIQPEPIPTANHGMAYFDADDFERHDIPPDPNGPLRSALESFIHGSAGADGTAAALVRCGRELMRATRLTFDAPAAGPLDVKVYGPDGTLLRIIPARCCSSAAP